MLLLFYPDRKLLLDTQTNYSYNIGSINNKHKLDDINFSKNIIICFDI